MVRAASPERIEVYDNSHVMGTTRSARCRRRARGFRKNEYRKSTASAGDSHGRDFEMMREVLGRRRSPRRRIPPEPREGRDLC